MYLFIIISFTLCSQQRYTLQMPSWLLRESYHVDTIVIHKSSWIIFKTLKKFCESKLLDEIMSLILCLWMVTLYQVYNHKKSDSLIPLHKGEVLLILWCHISPYIIRLQKKIYDISLNYQEFSLCEWYHLQKHMTSCIFWDVRLYVSFGNYKSIEILEEYSCALFHPQIREI